MEHQFEVANEVLIFGKYEGTIIEIKGDKAIIYCPAFDPAEPWLVTELSNIVLLKYNTGLLN